MSAADYIKPCSMRLLPHGGAGEPVELHLGAKAVSLDSGAAVITLDGGQTFQGEVVMGADGFHVSWPYALSPVLSTDLSTKILDIVHQPPKYTY